MTELEELRLRIEELEARPLERKYIPVSTPWMDAWRPIAKAPEVLYVVTREAADKLAAKHNSQGAL